MGQEAEALPHERWAHLNKLSLFSEEDRARELAARVQDFTYQREYLRAHPQRLDAEELQWLDLVADRQRKNATTAVSLFGLTFAGSFVAALQFASPSTPLLRRAGAGAAAGYFVAMTYFLRGRAKLHDEMSRLFFKARSGPASAQQEPSRLNG